MSMNLPLSLIYAGLGGTLLALFVATYQQNWQPRVFLLLALRLAIGWHFLFEGLHKIHSHWVGPTETNRPFSSEPYFALADGPLGSVVRKQALGDPDESIRTRIAPDSSKLANFEGLSEAQQAEYCPAPIAKILETAVLEGRPKLEEALAKAKADAEKAQEPDRLQAIQRAQAKAEAARPAVQTTADAARVAAEKAKVLQARAIVLEADLDPAKREAEWPKIMEARFKAKQAADQARADELAAVQAKNEQEKFSKEADDLKKKVDDALSKLSAAEARLNAASAEALKASYARWVYGVDRRDAKAQFVSTDVPQTVSERLQHIELLGQNFASLKLRQQESLGQGYGHEQKRTATAKNDWVNAKAELISDADAFVEELVGYAGAEMPEPAPKPIVAMDKLTMWVITIAGACILFGFMTPVACLVAAGFLLMTYLTHPPFPWLPLPPNTEGNPLFVNKNVIECLGLLVIAVHPTGRWLGLDALWTRLVLGTGTPEPKC